MALTEDKAIMLAELYELCAGSGTAPRTTDTARVAAAMELCPTERAGLDQITGSLKLSEKQELSYSQFVDSLTCLKPLDEETLQRGIKSFGFRNKLQMFEQGRQERSASRKASMRRMRAKSLVRKSNIATSPAGAEPRRSRERSQSRMSATARAQARVQALVASSSPSTPLAGPESPESPMGMSPLGFSQSSNASVQGVPHQEHKALEGELERVKAALAEAQAGNETLRTQVRKLTSERASLSSQADEERRKREMVEVELRAGPKDATQWREEVSKLRESVAVANVQCDQEAQRWVGHAQRQTEEAELWKRQSKTTGEELQELRQELRNLKLTLKERDDELAQHRAELVSNRGLLRDMTVEYDGVIQKYENMIMDLQIKHTETECESCGVRVAAPVLAATSWSEVQGFDKWMEDAAVLREQRRSKHVPEEEFWWQPQRTLDDQSDMLQDELERGPTSAYWSAKTRRQARKTGYSDPTSIYQSGPQFNGLADLQRSYGEDTGRENDRRRWMGLGV